MDEATLERALSAVKGIGEQAMAVGVQAGLLREGMSPGRGSFAVKLCILVSTSRHRLPCSMPAPPGRPAGIWTCHMVSSSRGRIVFAGLGVCFWACAQAVGRGSPPVAVPCCPHAPVPAQPHWRFRLC